ncbi:MAG: chemotaxis protein CheA [Pikeienuella sp.]
MTKASLPVETFMQEAQEVLETLEVRLLELESGPANPDIVDAVFRALHTLKGSGEMFGFSALAKFTHSFENAYDAVRAGQAEVTAKLIDLSLRSRDHIQALIEIGTDPDANARMQASPEGLGLLSELAAFVAKGSRADEAEASVEEGQAFPEGQEGPSRRFRLTFRPGRDAFRLGLRPDLLIAELAGHGTARIALDLSEVPPLEEIDASDCHLFWHGSLATTAARETIEDVFLFADEGALTLKEETDPSESPDSAATSPISGGTVAAVAPPALEVAEPPSVPTDAGKSGEMPAARPSKRATSNAAVRVQAHRLDALMDQLGELVIAQARLNRIAEESRDRALLGTAEEIERLITGLRDATLSIRMLPIATVFEKFRRVVRDLSAELGKDVILKTSGEDTELDKNVIDNLSEPLVHIVRNSIDHGVEPVEVRRAAGKSETATIRMTARQSGGEVLVTVADDGGGLKTDKIRARAVQRGLIEEGDQLSDQQINQLIFAPGFSTAETVSNVSGRGVGMDAVRSVITHLGGAVEVASTPGLGTEITLKLPLTLAIIEGLLVRVAGASYVLPLSSVEECADLAGAEIRRESGRAILTIRDELVPFLDLTSLFGLNRTEEGGDTRIVIVRAGTRRVGLVVDDIVGQHQTVIKSLSPYHRDIAGLAGGTILGDGAVALIIDPVALVKNAAAHSAEAA